MKIDGKRIVSFLLCVVLLITSVSYVKAEDSYYWPTPAVTDLSRGYGSGHKAIDIAAPEGTDIYATKAGTIIGVGNACSCVGNYPNCNHKLYIGSGWEAGIGSGVMIKHDDGSGYSLYAHMTADSWPQDVYVGAHVNQGQFIGKTGNTGNSTGPHLHFVLFDNASTNWWSCSKMNNNKDVIAYVYDYVEVEKTFVYDSSKFTNLYIDQLTDTSVKIGTEYAKESFNDVGFYFGTVNDINQMTKVSENKHGNVIFPQTSDGNSYKLGVWYEGYGYKWWEPLTAGTTYYWAFYLTQGNTEYISTVNSFTTTGDSVFPMIDSVTVTDLSSEGYTVEVVATDNVGVAKVCCPTWTTANEQDDLVNDWGNNAVATRVYDNTYTYRVNISDHNNERGTYATHVYVYDMTGNTAMNLDLTVEVPEPILPSTLNGLAQVDGSWGYYKNGVLQTNYTGLVQSSSTGTWYYVQKGKISWNYTGLVQSSSTGTWYYVENGRISWNYTGLVQSSSTGTWYYVENGRISWNYTGLAQSSSTGTWYYVENGRINWNYTGLVQSSSTDTWYYVEKGRISWNYTGLVQSKSTGTWYYIQKGRIAWNYTGIVKSGSTGNSYYVQNGRIAWTYTGLVKHTDGKLYYIKKGCVDWNYSPKEEDTIEVSWLHEMSALVGHNDKFWYTCSTTDNLGNGYKYQVFCGAESYSKEITYALDGKYKILSGTLGLRNADNDLKKGIWIEFYGDGKLIGETVHFVAGTRPYAFEIDVTGVTDLMIKTNSTSIYSSGYLLTDGFKVSE